MTGVICTNKKNYKSRLLCILCVAAVFLTGCGAASEEETVVLDDSYNGYTNYNIVSDSSSEYHYFSEDLCVIDENDLNLEKASYAYTSDGSGVFDLTKDSVIFSHNIYGKLYPASTTKILTAYIILSNCDLNATVTVSDNAVDQASDSSTCGLEAGDVSTVENLLYGMMLPSGNDAAIALAEYYSGSVEAFAEVMNETAKSLGATHSHFVNPNGLHDSEHYTTVYDMYLIFKEAIKNDTFRTIINTASKDVTYSDIIGNSVQMTYYNTNKYVSGDRSVPEGVQVIGGKTGTTGAAGYCLVLYSVNASGDEMVDIVYKSDTRSDLYGLMDQLISLNVD